jgi:E3 ubiquitin-protein ligase ZNF598
MSAIATAAPSHNHRGQGRRGRGGRGANRGAGRKVTRTNGKGLEGDTPSQKEAEPLAATTQTIIGKLSDKKSNEIDVCFICAEPVKYYSVSACNHRTCHVCALRLRSLYKKTDCTFCKVSAAILGEIGLERRNRNLNLPSSTQHPPMQNLRCSM